MKYLAEFVLILWLLFILGAVVRLLRINTPTSKTLWYIGENITVSTNVVAVDKDGVVTSTIRIDGNLSPYTPQ